LRDWGEQAVQSADLSLSGEQIHVWRIDLFQSVSVVQKLAQTLTEDEYQRAQRFRFEKDWRRFIVARGQLRSILAAYRGCTPSSVRFSYGPQGKPCLANVDDGSLRKGQGLQFNIAHSHELALCAVVTNRAIGVDIEYLRPLPDAEQLAQRFFSQAEHAQIQALPVDEQAQVFFRLWTGKEAYLKATGKGLSHPLNQVEIIYTDHEWRLAAALSGWSLQSFSPATNCLAALVVENSSAIFMGNRL
jgi:4'-phosphopantetheinyl transferase